MPCFQSLEPRYHNLEPRRHRFEPWHKKVWNDEWIGNRYEHTWYLTAPSKSGQACSGTAHSDIFLSLPPAKMCLPSVEKVTQHGVSECWNMAMVRRSKSRQRRTWLFAAGKATTVHYSSRQTTRHSAQIPIFSYKTFEKHLINMYNVNSQRKSTKYEKTHSLRI